MILFLLFWFLEYLKPTVTSSTTDRKPGEKVKPCDYERCPPYAQCKNNPQTGVSVCQCNKPCSLRPNRVCATNMQQYLNTCFMEVDSCKANMKFEVYKRGLCPPPMFNKNWKHFSSQFTYKCYSICNFIFEN